MTEPRPKTPVAGEVPKDGMPDNLAARVYVQHDRLDLVVEDFLRNPA